MHEKQAIEPVRVPLEEALADVAALIREVEAAEAAGEEAPDAVALAWPVAVQNVGRAVDRMIAAHRHIDGVLEATESMLDMLKARERVLKRAQTRIEERVRGAIMENPDLEFVGTLGRFSIESVGGKPALEWTPDYERAVTRLPHYEISKPVHITPAMARHMRVVTCTVFDKAAYENEIRAGEIEDPTVAYVLPRGTKVRIR